MPLRLEWRTPAELKEHPKNWRTHPENQVAALNGIIGEVGWAGAVLFNERTGHIIDGHARRKVPKKLLIDGKLPVLIGRWSKEDEAKILATHDPIAMLARQDNAKLDALLASVKTSDDAVRAMLANMASASSPADDAVLAELKAGAAGAKEEHSTIANDLTLIAVFETPAELAEARRLLRVAKSQSPATAILTALRQTFGPYLSTGAGAKPASTSTSTGQSP